GSGDFSIQLWANFASKPDTTTFAFAGHDEGGGTTNKWIFYAGGTNISGSALGSIGFHAVNGSTSAYFSATAPFDPTPGQWYLIDLVKSGSSYNFYANNKLLGSVTETLTLPDANAPLTIGESEGAFYFNGALDDVAIYHRALSGAEIY